MNNTASSLEIVSKEPPTLPALSKPQQFAAFVQAGVDAWTKAGELLVEMVEANPSAYAEIIKECPNISVDVLLAFERIGRKKVYPHLMIDTSPGARRLLALPYDLQEKYHKATIEVCCGEKEGVPLSTKKSISALSSHEAAMVIGPNGIRTVEEQASFGTAKKSKVRVPTAVPTRTFKSIGFYKLSFVAGEPRLTKIPNGGFNSQRVIVGKIMNEDAAVIDATIEVCKDAQES